ncbi:MAG: MFS transporter [Thermoplasmata archaeon]
MGEESRASAGVEPNEESSSTLSSQLSSQKTPEAFPRKRMFAEPLFRLKADETWFLTYLANNVSNAITSPLITLYCFLELNMSLFKIGLIQASYFLSAIPGSIFWAKVYDKYKAKHLFVFAGFVSAGACLICMALLQSFRYYFLLNFLGGFFISSVAPMLTLAGSFSDNGVWTSREDAMGRITGLGSLLGLLISIGWTRYVLFVGSSDPTEAMKYLFLIAGSFLIAAGLLSLIFFRKDPHKHLEKGLPPLKEVTIFSDRWVEKNRFIPFPAYNLLYKGKIIRVSDPAYHLHDKMKIMLMAIFLITTGTTIFLTPFPIFLADRYAASLWGIFIIYFMNGLCSFLISLLAVRMVTNRHPRAILSVTTILRGFLFLIAGLLSITILGIPAALGLFLLAILFSFAGVLWPYFALASNKLAREYSLERGGARALGIYGTVVSGSTILGSIAGGALGMFNYPTAFVLSGVLTLAGTALLLLLPKEMAKEN